MKRKVLSLLLMSTLVYGASTVTNASAQKYDYSKEIGQLYESLFEPPRPTVINASAQKYGDSKKMEPLYEPKCPVDSDYDSHYLSFQENLRVVVQEAQELDYTKYGHLWCDWIPLFRRFFPIRILSIWKQLAYKDLLKVEKFVLYLVSNEAGCNATKLGLSEDDA